MAVQQFVDHLVRVGRTYSTIAGYVNSFIALARFVHAVRAARASAGTTLSTVPVEDMRRIHQQAMQKARVERKFTSKPPAWLDWGQVQAARARAVRQYEHGEGQGSDEEQRKRLFDAALGVTIRWIDTTSALALCPLEHAPLPPEQNAAS